MACFLVSVTTGSGDVSVELASVNGGIGLVATAGGKVTHVGVVDGIMVDGAAVACQILVVASPSKLRYVDRQVSRRA